MSDVDIELKREEDERLDTAEDPNDEVRFPSMFRNHAFICKHDCPYKAVLRPSTPDPFIYNYQNAH